MIPTWEEDLGTLEAFNSTDQFNLEVLRQCVGQPCWVDHVRVEAFRF